MNAVAAPGRERPHAGSGPVRPRRRPPARRAARAVLVRAVRGGGERGTGFGEALIGEFDAIGTTWESVRWAASGLPFAWRERRRRRASDRRAAPAVPPRTRLTRRILVPVLGLLIAAAAVNWLVAGTAYIPSASMSPTLRVGDRVLVDKIGYRLTGLHRGDIVLVNWARPGAGAPTDFLIKRVAGLPGDTITCRDGMVYRDGTPLGGGRSPAIGCDPVTVGPGQIYLLGDDRALSVDSRQIGTVARSSVTGRVVARIWRPGG